MESMQKDWDLSVSVITTDNGPGHFCSENLPLRENQICLSRDQDSLISSLLCLSTWKVSFGITACNPADVLHSNIMYNSFAIKQLETELTEKCQRFGSKVELIPSFAYFPNDLNSVEKGFFVRASTESAESVRVLIAEVARKYGQAAYFEYEIEGGKMYQKLNITITDTNTLVCSSPLVQVVPPECHPLFSHSSLHPVFQDKAKVYMVLSEACKLKMEFNISGIEELVDIGDRTSALDVNSQIPAAKSDVIVVEGLDGTGKTTLCSKLSTSLGATLLCSPPDSISHLRSSFDAHPPLVRRAYYSLGNYILAQEIEHAAQSGPVVVDRYWNSSAAYAIATEVGCGDSSHLPPEGHNIYDWPQDLLKPDVVVLLTVSAEERLKRIKSRDGCNVTKEEERIEESPQFRDRILTSYERMTDPTLVRVDASGTSEEVLKRVRDVLGSKNL